MILWGLLTMDELKHNLIPKHIKISDSEKEELFNKYKISISNLPKISITDPAILHLNAKSGDVIRIDRESETAGSSVFYRGVSNE